MDLRRLPRWLVPALVALLLAAWIGWLRAPSIPAPMWNVDESIHAGVARRILDGGVLYRDAIDQRTPLTYYVFAAIFRVAGVNNLPATRVVLCGLIAATGFGLFLLGRRTRRPATGAWAALTFSAFACYLIFPGDAFAAHTEWFVIFFTTAAALLFLSAENTPSPQRAFGVGTLLALAFLSKQTALIDSLVPAGTLVACAATRRWPWRDTLRAAVGLALGFAAVTSLVVLVLVALGAGRDLLFYTWTYNLRYYGPEIEWGQRLLSCRWFLAHLIEFYPVAAVLGVAGLVVVALRAAQLAPTPAIAATRAPDIFLLLWCGTSLFGAIASGRGFDHYFIQCMPPFAWLAAWLPGWLTDRFRRDGTLSTSTRTTAARVFGAVTLLALAINLLFIPPGARALKFSGYDPAYPLSEFIRNHSRPDEKIFVWGYNPDIYLYTNRAPASRFLYCTFQTGLIPWTNLDPAKDTAYAIVPGTMDQLLADLARERPRFIVDCGVGPHRHFQKYPLKNFPALRDFVAAHYVEINPPLYNGHGFRVFMIRDRLQPPGPTVAASDLHPAPAVARPPLASVGPNTFGVSANATTASLRRLALVVDDVEVAAVRFPPAEWMRYNVNVPFADANTRHRVFAVAEWADGTRTASSPIEFDVVAFSSTTEQRAAFALPRVTSSVNADGVRALINPNAHWNDGVHEFALHAPSLVRYTLPAGALALRGRYTLPPGAYAPDNKTPSDGAEFIIRAVTPDNKARILLDRLLRPAREAADRPVQNFRVSLEGIPAGSTLELEISPGPDGNPSSDWTSWSDVELETSP